MPISHGLRLGPDELLLFSNNILAYKTSMCGNSEAPTDFLIRPLSPQKKIITDLGPRNQGPTKKKAFTQCLLGLNLKFKNVHTIPVRIQLQCEREMTEMKNVNFINLFNPTTNNIIRNLKTA